MQIIGIDCATLDHKMGIALASYRETAVEVHEILTGTIAGSVVKTLSNWLSPGLPALLALDAPLGWPSAFGETFSHHAAGQPIGIAPNQLFWRLTDRVVKDQIGRQPLDVGADRIARTAHAALAVLQSLRLRTGADIQLSWRPDDIHDISAIEVYPAATLSVYGIQATAYKEKSQLETRRSMVEQLGRYLKLPETRKIMLSSADALDAVICVLAGADYLRGTAIQPPEDGRVRKEGWIWVRAPLENEG